jgi:hypothetical protein
MVLFKHSFARFHGRAELQRHADAVADVQRQTLPGTSTSSAFAPWAAK